MFTVKYIGRIQFEPENETKKHIAQSSWKKVAMILFDGDIDEYYIWLFKRRFNIELNKPLRNAHITFINDRIGDINNSIGSTEEKEALWSELKKKWDGKEISVTLNLRPFNDLGIEQNFDGLVESEKTSISYHWWLIVDHNFRDELHDIRAEIGLGKPYYGLHMTFGILTQNFKLDKDGKLILDENNKPIPVFNFDLEQALYINNLHEKGFIEINKDYGQ